MDQIIGQDPVNSFLQPMATRSLVEQIVERITNAIISGELKAGDKIPTELELSESIGVGRNSVREAIKILVSFGVLQIKRAEGTFVCDSYCGRMIDPLVYSLILEKDASKHIIELRRVFETGILDVAVRRISAEQLTQLEQAFLYLKKVASSPDATVDQVLGADIAFHQVLVKNTDNYLIDRVSNMIERLTIPSRKQTIAQLMADGNGQQMIALHAELVDAIRSHNPAIISEAMEHHFSYWVREVNGT
jgi:GntR family transcriptional regulator, transcriptional repressor for pyruvate dehydrogenase complex